MPRGGGGGPCILCFVFCYAYPEISSKFILALIFFGIVSYIGEEIMGIIAYTVLHVLSITILVCFPFMHIYFGREHRHERIDKRTLWRSKTMKRLHARGGRKAVNTFIRSEIKKDKFERRYAGTVYGHSKRAINQRQDEIKTRGYEIVILENAPYKGNLRKKYNKPASNSRKLGWYNNQYTLSIIDELRTIHWQSVTKQDPLPWNNINFAYVPWPIDGFHYVKTKSQVPVLVRQHFELFKNIQDVIEKHLQSFDAEIKVGAKASYLNVLVDKIHTLCKVLDEINNSTEFKHLGLTVRYINFGEYEGLVFHILPWKENGSKNEHWDGVLPNNITISLLNHDNNIENGDTKYNATKSFKDLLEKYRGIVYDEDEAAAERNNMVTSSQYVIGSSKNDNNDGQASSYVIPVETEHVPLNALVAYHGRYINATRRKNQGEGDKDVVNNNNNDSISWSHHRHW